MSGGSVPKYGGIVLDMKKMDQILEINPKDSYAHIQSGVNIYNLDQMLRKTGYMLSIEPGSAPSATVGGTLSTSAVSYRQGVLGAVMDSVLGMKVVLPTGNIINCGRNTGRLNFGKSSVGPDLCHLFVGDFGSLGIKTEAVLKIYPVPEIEELHFIVFPDMDATMAAVEQLLSMNLPCIYKCAAVDREYMVKQGAIYGSPVYGGGLLVGYMGHAKLVKDIQALAGEVWDSFKGQNLETESSADKQKNRYDFYPTMIVTGKPAARWHYEDPTIQVSKIADLLKNFHEIVARYGFDDWGGETLIYDSSSSLSAIMYAWDETDEENWDKYCACANEIVESALQMGGSISNCLGYDGRETGRHGKDLLKLEYGDDDLEAIRSIKKTFDPNWIMNPGYLSLADFQK